jgi:hypothetical protein
VIGPGFDFDRLWRLLAVAMIVAVPFTFPSLAIGHARTGLDPASTTGFGFTLTAYLILTIFAGVLLVVQVAATRRLPRPALGWPELFLALTIAISYLSIAWSGDRLRSFRLDTNLVAAAFAYLVLKELARKGESLRMATLALASGALAVSLIGLLQYFTYRLTLHQIPIVPMPVIPWSGARLQSTLAGPNYFGSYAALAMPVLVAAWTRGGFSRRQSALLWVTSAVLLLATLLTYSRTNQVLVLVPALLAVPLAFRRPAAWLFLAFLVGTLGVAWFSATPQQRQRTEVAATHPSQDPNFQTRQKQVAQGISVVIQNPIGVGAGSADQTTGPQVNAPTGASTATRQVLANGSGPAAIHNDIISRFAETGIVGGLIYVALLASFAVLGARALWRLRRRRDAFFWLAGGWYAGFFATLAGEQFYPRVYEPSTWLAYAMTAAVAVVALKAEAAQGDAAQDRRVDAHPVLAQN